MMENFQVVMRVRPLTCKQQEQIVCYQKAFGQSKKNTINKTKSVNLNPSLYSFYSKYHNCQVNQIIKVDENTIYVADPQYKNTQKAMRQFPFCSVFDQNCNNQDFFKRALIGNLEILAQGYNCTIMAYGITGSGKTYTVFGQQTKFDDPGICYLACCYLIQLKQSIQEKGGKMSFKFSFMQIYNQNVKDLLSVDSKIVNVVEDSKNGGTSIMDLTQKRAQKLADVLKLVTDAANKRVTSSTQANQNSSRSHAILRVSIEIQTKNQQGSIQILTPKLFIIDLAGSEKLQSMASNSKKNSEGTNINKSLLALGNCINALAENSKKSKLEGQKYIPYRDSKLTRILKDSLGGNSKTVMIACISPNPFTVDQTLTTLSYATRAQGIKKIIYKNQINHQSNQKQAILIQYMCKQCKARIENQETYSSQKQRQKKHRQSLFGNKLVDIFNQIYQDVVENVRQSQKIKHLNQNLLIPEQQIHKLQKTNQQQAKILKNTLFQILINANRQNIDTICLQQKNSQCQVISQSNVTINQNSLNKLQRDVQLNVSNSIKSSRSRSRSKIQIIKRNKSKQNISYNKQAQTIITENKL